MARSGSLGAVIVLWIASACFAQEPRRAERPGDWSLAAPESVGLDANYLHDLQTAADTGAFRNLHAILVARHGKLVFESYHNGFEANRLQYTASVSKSVGSVLLGIAMDVDVLPGLDDGVLDRPLAELLPEYGDVLAAEPEKLSILFRHALSMTGGLEWDETSLPYSDPRNDWIRASRGADPIGFALARPLVSRPGEQFNYHGVYSILPSYLIQRETGASAEAFAAAHLFQPLGIAAWEWETIASGLTDTDGGLHLRPRDMAKLGQLYLDGGVWEGRRVVSESWIRESTKCQVDNREMPDYALLWWCGELHYGDRSAGTYFASGHGGQRVHVFPDHDLVVVITQQVFDNPFNELNAQAILTRYVLPGADPSYRRAPRNLKATELARFEGRYVGNGRWIEVTMHDGTLVAETPDAPPMPLVPLGEGSFRGTVLDLIDVHFAFESDSSGQPLELRATWGFRDEVFRRVGQ